MGQHQIQKQILRNFSFKGQQPNSRETWFLTTRGHQPISRSVDRVGFFRVDCSEDVDDYITDLENRFKDSLRQFSHGDFTKANVGREIYDFIAMHYVRSAAYLLQIEHVVARCLEDSGLTLEEASAELRRLASHQDAAVFRDLVDSVSRTLTHYVLYPLLITGPWLFVTSDKIMCASTVESERRETFVWFPISSSIGLCLMSDGYTGQILGPVVEVNRQSKRISFAKLPEAGLLRCQAPSPQKGSEEFVNTLNGMIVKGSTELYAADRNSMDSALRMAELPNGYRYQPGYG